MFVDGIVGENDPMIGANKQAKYVNPSATNNKLFYPEMELILNIALMGI